MRNLGAEKAQGRWVFFKDSDCDIDFDKVVQFCEKMERESNPIVAVGGVYKNDSQSFFGKAYNFIQRIWVLNGAVPKAKTNGIQEGRQLLGGAFLVKRHAFLEAGGFDETIGWGGEELELTGRLRRMGYKTGISYNLRVSHGNNLNIFGFIKRAWYQNYNKSFFQFNTQTTWKSRRRYFNTPILYWPSTALFFGVAQFASSAGSIFGKARRRWK